PRNIHFHLLLLSLELPGLPGIYADSQAKSNMSVSHRSDLKAERSIPIVTGCDPSNVCGFAARSAMK
ncbi:MAG: hypothetical protein WCA98_07920, partial [Candidatus Acidiferrales bacterium]